MTPCLKAETCHPQDIRLVPGGVGRIRDIGSNKTLALA